MSILDDHFDELARLILVERDAEKEENKRELDRWPVEVRETLGKTVTRLSVERLDRGLGGMPLLVVSRKPAGERLAPFFNMDQGDVVRLTFSTGQKMDGTLYDVDEYRASVALSGPPLAQAPEGRCQIDLLGSDATYKRMEKAINKVRRAKGAGAHLRDVILGLEKPDVQEPPMIDFFDDGLNQFQKQAVHMAGAARDVALIHGPPGTGKTTVLVEIIRQAAARGDRILASAPSNVAVDNMLDKLIDTPLKIVRLGHPARTSEYLRHATLAAQIDEHPQQKTIRDLDHDRERLAIQLDRRRDRGYGMTADQVKEAQKEMKAMWKEARSIERSLADEIIGRAQVVLATHGGIGQALARYMFDLVVLDEASQSTEALSWVPISHARRVVLAGDPLQLPPTLFSEEARKGLLGVTLMDGLYKTLPEESKTLLRVQYRMNNVIMGFSSKQFYEDKLIAHESVSDHLAKDLKGVQATDLTGRPMVYIDTAGTGFHEVWNEPLDSRENEGEAQVVLKVMDQLKAAGLYDEDMAVITPYSAQVRLLKQLVPRTVEINTVDGFQGREKEIVIVSLVRSNEKGEVGFLRDTRRMNVAMTRARRLLVVVGDSGTLSQNPFYAAFFEYAEKYGANRSAWEFVTPA